MLIEGPYCNSRVDAKEHGHRVEPGGYDDPDESRVVVAECSSCHATLVGRQHQVETEFGTDWSDAARLWPKPKRRSDWDIPDIVDISLQEAELCLASGAYSACAVMCGRALEGICVHFKTKKKMLHEGLKELRDSDVIDKRLYAWGEELRKVRNLGAHASTERVPQKDADDVLTFVHAIANYVFVLNEQFNSFMSRRKPKELKTPVAKAAEPDKPAAK